MPTQVYSSVILHIAIAQLLTTAASIFVIRVLKINKIGQKGVV